MISEKKTKPWETTPMPACFEAELKAAYASGNMSLEDLHCAAKTICDNGWENPTWFPTNDNRKERAEDKAEKDNGTLIDSLEKTDSESSIKKRPCTEGANFSAEAEELEILEGNYTPTDTGNQRSEQTDDIPPIPFDTEEFRIEPDNIIPFGDSTDANYQSLKKEVWSTRPRPGLNYIQVFAPHDKAAKIRYSYKMNNDWTAPNGKRWRHLEFRMRKGGAETEFVDYYRFSEKEANGWIAPKTPKFFGIEYVRETLPSDYVFVTENILDYWILNQALSKKLLSRGNEYVLDPHEATGCAIFPYGGYDFSQEAANAELSDRKVVFIDYGDNSQASEKIKKSAERLSSQGLAESIYILNVDPRITANGGFYGLLGKWEEAVPESAKNPNHILAYVNAVHGELFGVDGLAKSLTEIKTADDGGRAADFIDECGAWEFVLYPVLPKGEINFLAGDSGTGKSQIATEWAERLTNGRLQLGESKYDPDDLGPQVVGWFTMEEDLRKSVFPRARQYGVNLERFFAFDCLEHPFGDDWYERTIKGNGINVAVFDSYGMFFEGDNNAERDTARIMRWLTSLIRKTEVTILLIAHFNKKEASGLTERVAGSHRLKDSVRCGWIAVRDPARESSVVVAPAKASFVRGTDTVCNLVYQRNSIDDRDAQPEVRLVDCRDTRKLVEIEAMIRAQRRLAGDEADEALGIAGREPHWERIMKFGLECLETKGYIHRGEMTAYSSHLGNSSRKPVDEAIRAIKKDYDLKLATFRKTIFFHLSTGDEVPASDEKVYVKPSDLSDTYEGMVKIIKGLDKRLTPEEFSRMIGAPRNRKKSIKQVFETMVVEKGWIKNADGSIQPPHGTTRGGQIEGQVVLAKGMESYIL